MSSVREPHCPSNVTIWKVQCRYADLDWSDLVNDQNISTFVEAREALNWWRRYADDSEFRLVAVSTIVTESVVDL